MSHPYQLAQINVAHAMDDLHSETLAGFVSRLDEINHLADQAPGFIWRLVPDQIAHYKPGYTNPRIIVNISVWDSVDSLKAYVYRTNHVELIKQKSNWFESLKAAHMALWWVPAGTRPTEKDGVERLNILRENGPSNEAFLIAKPFPSPV